MTSQTIRLSDKLSELDWGTRSLSGVSDIPQLLQLTKEIIAEFGIARLTRYYDEHPSEFEADFHQKGSWARILLVDGEIVGYILIHPKTEDPNVCELAKLYLKASHRGFGLGDLLMKRALRQAEEQGYNTLYITTAREFGVKSFYERFGAQEVEDLRYPDNPNSLAMEIDLTGSDVDQQADLAALVQFLNQREENLPLFDSSITTHLTDTFSCLIEVMNLVSTEEVKEQLNLGRKVKVSYSWNYTEGRDHSVHEASQLLCTILSTRGHDTELDFRPGLFATQLGEAGGSLTLTVSRRAPHKKNFRPAIPVIS